MYLTVFFVPIHGLEDVHGARAAAFALIVATTLALGLILGSEWKPFSTLTQVMAVGAAYSSGGEWMLSATGDQIPLDSGSRPEEPEEQEGETAQWTPFVYNAGRMAM